MKSKKLLIVSTICFSFYNCVDEDEEQLQPVTTTIVEQKRESDLRIELDSMDTADSVKDEADPPKDKDPYIKRNEEGGE